MRPPTTTAPDSRFPRKIKPFPSAERAWLWTAACLAARRAGKSPIQDTTGPCSPDTILRCLDQLYRDRRIDLTHARILRIWGDRGRAPRHHTLKTHGDWPQWHHALCELDRVLRDIGVVAGFDLTLPPPRQNFFLTDRITFTFKSETPLETVTKEI